MTGRTDGKEREGKGRVLVRRPSSSSSQAPLPLIWQVSEMTGRKGRIVEVSGGGMAYQKRTEGLRDEHDAKVAMEKVNLEERAAFMRGDKLVAIISEAASCGISLQARAPLPRGPLPRDPRHVLMSEAASSAPASRCRRTSASPTRGGACTSRWSCRGLQTRPSSSAAGRTAPIR